MASALEIIVAIFPRTTGWFARGFPKALRWLIHLRQLSMMCRWERAELQHMTHRSWLKLLWYLGIRSVWRDEEQSQSSREDNENSSTLRPKCVFNGHFHVVKGDISSTGGRRVAGLDRLGLDTFTSRNQDDCKAIFGLATGGEAAGRASISLREWTGFRNVTLTSRRTCRQ